MLKQNYEVVLLKFYFEMPQHVSDQQCAFYTKAVLSYKAKDPLKTAQKLLDMIEVRRRSLELYHLIDKVISRLEREKIQILKQRFFVCKKNFESENERRKFYRQSNKALSRFKVLLGYADIDEKKFVALLKSDSFLSSIYQKQNAVIKNQKTVKFEYRPQYRLAA